MEHSQEEEEAGQKKEVPLPAKIMGRVKSNLAFRSSKWAEVNGAMGDLGTYIPIVLALTLARGLDLGTTLIFTGAYNVITGAFYGVPMPVQPMKSIAAAALADPDFGVPEIMAAGILTGAALIALGATGLMGLVYRLVPLPVVRGIQLAQGLSFSLTAVKYVRKLQDLPKSKALGTRPWLGLDGLVLAVACASFVVLVSGTGDDDKGRESEPEPEPEPRRRWRRILFSLPSAFMVSALGVALAFARRPGLVREIELGPSSISAARIPARAWRDGFVKGTVPQLPLSALNSVVAVVKLSADLFPGRGEFSATSLSVTVGLMNVAGCWFGAMPCCHGGGGAGGAVQVRGSERGLRGPPRGSQGRPRPRPRDVPRRRPLQLPGRDSRGAASLRRDRARHDVSGHELKGGRVHSARVYRGVLGGVQRGPRVPRRDGRLRPLQDQDPRVHRRQASFRRLDPWDPLKDI